MKTIKILFCLMLSSCTILNLLTKQESFSYPLKVRLMRKLHEPIFGFYKGKPLELGADCAIITECSKVPAFSLIIAPDMTHEAEGNNVRYLRRKEDVPFLWYDLTLRTPTVEEAEEKLGPWDIKKLDPEEAPLQIPEHAIVIYFNPDYIEKIENITLAESCKNSTTAASHVIPLPAIVIRSDIPEDELEQAAVEALLASLELRTIHKKSSVDIKREQRTLISICKSL